MNWSGRSGRNLKDLNIWYKGRFRVIGTFLCLFLECFPKIKCIAAVAVETCSLYSKFSDWNPLSWCFVRWWMDWWIVKGWIQRQPTPPSVVTTFSTEFIEGRDMEGWIIDTMNVILQVYVQCHHRNYYKEHLSFLFVPNEDKKIQV